MNGERQDGSYERRPGSIKPILPLSVFCGKWMSRLALLPGWKSRKKVCSFTNADVKFIAREESIYLDNEKQQDSSIRVRDYTSKDARYEDGVYVFVLNKNGKSEFVKLELSDKTIDHVNNFFRGKYKE